MAYTKFLDEAVFADANANIYCNRIYELLEASFPGMTLNQVFCLTGTPAKIIQGASVEEITVIPFITDQDSIFDYFGTKLSEALGAQGAVYLSESIQVVISNELFVELWLTSPIGTINTVTNIDVQDPADIPSHIN